MKIKYIGETIPLGLTWGKIYDVISIEKGWFRIIDDEGGISGRGTVRLSLSAGAI